MTMMSDVDLRSAVLAVRVYGGESGPGIPDITKVYREDWERLCTLANQIQTDEDTAQAEYEQTVRSVQQPYSDE